MTEKMDGENTNIYPNGHCHARSTDSRHHPSRSWVKSLAGQVAHNLSENLRICGENLYAYHSILYTDLPSYLLVFGTYEGSRCLSWDDTLEICELLDLQTVPVIYRGVWDEEKIRSLWTGKGKYPTYETESDNPTFPDDFKPTDAEGYVVRLAESFDYADFQRCCAKFVRANHVRTSSHWMSKPIFPNLLYESQDSP